VGPPLARGAEPAAAGTDAAQALYAKLCRRCHGPDGKGGRKGGDDVPDFTRASWQRGRGDAQLLVSILEGKGDGMPAFDGRLNADQARGLVAHVRALSGRSPTPAANSAPLAGQGEDFRQPQEQLTRPNQESQRPAGRPDETPRAEPPRAFSDKLIAWLGNVHPPAVHFPLALLTAAAVAELLRLVTGQSAFDPVCRFCLWFGFLTAVVAGALGWFAGGLQLNDAAWVLRAHRWLGSSAVACAGLALALGEVSRRSGRFRLGFRISLFGAAGVVLAAGFFGGALVFGLDHYAWPP
jgi:uncharacterized membrane protein/cytochrome c5